MTNLYECDCDDCRTKATVLNLGTSEAFKNLLNIGYNAFKQLHKNGSYSPKDLQTEPIYKELIQQTFDTFDFAIQDNDMPDVMRTALQNDAFTVAGLKTHTQLFEAGKMLLDANGNLKSFSQLENDFNKLNSTYNRTYLESEYEFAVASSQMAAKWTELGDSDRYSLQYRTAKDDRVRDEHRPLADTTLPKDDAFWDSYYPPNGWRCRCTAVEVLKDKYETSNSADAIAKGEKATTQTGKDGKNRLEIFRFNPGKDKKLFPPKMPYNANRCTGDGKLSITGLIGAPVFVLSAEKSKCEAAKIVEAMQKEKQKAELKQQRTEVKQWAKENIVGKTITHPSVEKPILFTTTGIKEALNQPHQFIKEKNGAIRTIQKLIKESEFVKTDKDSKGRDIEYHYLKTKINDVDSFIVIKRQDDINSFYSITDKIKE